MRPTPAGEELNAVDWTLYGQLSPDERLKWSLAIIGLNTTRAATRSRVNCEKHPSHTQWALKYSKFCFGLTLIALLNAASLRISALACIGYAAGDHARWHR
jgi:hypothetical protein